MAQAAGAVEALTQPVAPAAGEPATCQAGGAVMAATTCSPAATAVAAPEHQAHLVVATQQGACQNGGKGLQNEPLSKKARKRRNRKARLASEAAQRGGHGAASSAAVEAAGQSAPPAVAAPSKGKHRRHGTGRSKARKSHTASAHKQPAESAPPSTKATQPSAKGLTSAASTADTQQASVKNKFAARLKQRMPSSGISVSLFGARALHGLAPVCSGDAGPTPNSDRAAPPSAGLLSAPQLGSDAHVQPGDAERLVRSEPVLPSAAAKPAAAGSRGTDSHEPAVRTAAASPPLAGSSQVGSAGRDRARVCVVPPPSTAASYWGACAASAAHQVEQRQGCGSGAAGVGAAAPCAVEDMTLAQRIHAARAGHSAACSTSVPDVAAESRARSTAGSAARVPKVPSQPQQVAPMQLAAEVQEPAAASSRPSALPRPAADDSGRPLPASGGGRPRVGQVQSTGVTCKSLQDACQQQRHEAAGGAAHVSGGARECDVCGVEQDAHEFQGASRTCVMCAAAIGLDHRAACAQGGAGAASVEPARARPAAASRSKRAPPGGPTGAQPGGGGTLAKKRRVAKASPPQPDASASLASSGEKARPPAAPTIQPHGLQSGKPPAERAPLPVASSSLGAEAGSATHQVPLLGPEVVILLPDVEKPTASANVAQTAAQAQQRRSASVGAGPREHGQLGGGGGLLAQWTSAQSAPNAGSGPLPLWLGGANAAEQSAASEAPGACDGPPAGGMHARSAAATVRGSDSSAPCPLQSRPLEQSRRADRAPRGVKRRRVSINVEPAELNAATAEPSAAAAERTCDAPPAKTDGSQPAEAPQARAAEAAAGAEPAAAEPLQHSAAQPALDGAQQAPAHDCRVDHGPGGDAFVAEQLGALATDAATHAALLDLVRRSYAAGAAAASARQPGRDGAGEHEDAASDGADVHTPADACPERPQTPTVTPTDAEQEVAAPVPGVAQQADGGDADAETVEAHSVVASQEDHREPGPEPAEVVPSTSHPAKDHSESDGPVDETGAPDAGVNANSAGTSNAADGDVADGSSKDADRRQEVEDLEWARRRQIIERQAAQARAEKEERRRQQVRAGMRAREQAAVAERSLVERIKAEKRTWLARLFAPGMSVRQGLQSLNVAVGPGVAGERAALKRARVFYHPDSAKRRDASLEERVACEEVFKALGALRASSS